MDDGELIENAEEAYDSDVEEEILPQDSDFFENLALKWNEDTLSKIASELCESIERDREARKKRDKQQEDGLKRTGMGDEAPGGAEFEGASKVTHPVITTCTVDFAARAIKELHPPEGPVKPASVGQTTKQRMERADRIRRHMNVQLTRDIVEYRPELERLLTQLPMGGSQYMKWYWNRRLKRASCDFIPIDNIFLPFNASSMYSADRVTHWQVITPLEFDRRVRTGMYRDLDEAEEPSGSASSVQQTDSQLANNKIEGKSDQAEQGDEDIKEIYEVYTYLEEDDPLADFEFGPCPYIVSIDVQDRKVLSVYRNWEEGDETYKALDWIVDFGFIPWRGAYCVGLPHLIGGLSAAATGALRALLDSAHIANSATMLKLKGGRVGGQSNNVSVGGIHEIDGGTVDDIRKIAMPMPFNPPSPVLFQLLGALDELARGVVRTVLEDNDGGGSEVPVGTQLSRVENGMVVFSAIHSRLHASLRKCLEILYRLNRQYLDDQEIIDEFGEVLVRREDYEGAMDIMPVSDPHIFSEAQRAAQNQGVVQMMATAPEIYDVSAVHRRVLETMRVPNIDELIPKKPEPTPQNPVAENVQMMMGKPAFAFPDQDHLAHIEVLLKCLEDPNYGMSPIIAPVFIPAALEHLKQHMAFWYANQMIEIVNNASGMDLTELPYSMEFFGNKLDALLAQAAGYFRENSEKALQGIPPIIQQAQQVMAQMQPQGQDPSVMIAQAAMKDANVREKKVQIDADVKKSEQQLKAEKDKIEAELKAREIAADVEKSNKKNETDLIITAIKEQVKPPEIEASPEKEKEESENNNLDKEIIATLAENTRATTEAIIHSAQITTQAIVQGIAESNRNMLSTLAAPKKVTKSQDGSWVSSIEPQNKEEPNA